MKIDETGYESRLALNKLYFEEITFRRAEEIHDDMAIKLTINRNIEELSQNNYVITVALGLSDRTEDLLNISLKAVGKFKLIDADNMDEDFKHTIIEKNTLSIMFPFIRSQVSLITAQPGLTPLILPAISINDFLDKADSHK